MKEELTNWKLLFESVQGSSHKKLGQPCQDYAAAICIDSNDGTIALIACADGAGSAQFSDVGSKLACENIIRIISEYLQKGLLLDAVDRDRVVLWHHELQAILHDEATQRGAVPRDLASTLLVSIVGENRAVFSQVGDGVIIIYESDTYEPIFWPQSGEYLNTTNFVTDREVDKVLDFCTRDTAVKELAVLSDGLQMLALNLKEKKVHAPFFSPMFAALRGASADDLRTPLHDFLDSEAVSQRTDDDRTLVLATRLPESLIESR